MAPHSAEFQSGALEFNSEGVEVKTSPPKSNPGRSRSSRVLQIRIQRARSLLESFKFQSRALVFNLLESKSHRVLRILIESARGLIGRSEFEFRSLEVFPGPPKSNSARSKSSRARRNAVWRARRGLRSADLRRAETGFPPPWAKILLPFPPQERRKACEQLGRAPFLFAGALKEGEGGPWPPARPPVPRRPPSARPRGA